MRRSTRAYASRVDRASSEVTGDAPARVRRFPAEGRHGYRIWSEFGANRTAGDRPEIAGDRTRSDEIDRDRPTFADLRSTSPASGPFDPIWSILKPPN